MMTEVHTVSIVAKNRYSAKAGGRPHPSRCANEGQETVDQGQKVPAMIFASRFALNVSSRDATIMAMGISIKTAEPIRTQARKSHFLVGDLTKGFSRPC
jgi:hypothetical protein